MTTASSISPISALTTASGNQCELLSVVVVVVVSSVELSSDEEEPLEPKGDGLGVGVGDISAEGILADDPLIDADEPGAEAAPEGALTSGGTLVPGELAEVWAKLGTADGRQQSPRFALLQLRNH